MVALDYTKRSGSTTRDDYKLISEKTGKSISELYGEELITTLSPYEEYIMGVFEDISSGRSFGMHGPNMLSYQEIKAYCELMDEQLSRWEVETIKSIDRVYVESIHTQSEKDKEET